MERARLLRLVAALTPRWLTQSATFALSSSVLASCHPLRSRCAGSSLGTSTFSIDLPNFQLGLGSVPRHHSFLRYPFLCHFEISCLEPSSYGLHDELKRLDLGNAKSNHKCNICRRHFQCEHDSGGLAQYRNILAARVTDRSVLDLR